MAAEKEKFPDFADLVSEITDKSSRKKIKLNKNELFNKYGIANNEKKRDVFKSYYYLMKLIEDKSIGGKKKLRETLHRETGVKINFIQGVKKFFKEKQDEASSFLLLSLMFLAYSPMLGVKLSWSFLPNILLFNISTIVIGLIVPLTIIFMALRDKVLENNLEEECMRYVKNRTDDEFLTDGVNKADFLYQIERTQNEEKNLYLLDEIIKVEEKGWVNNGLSDKLKNKMVVNYKYSLEDFFTEKEIKDINQKILSLRKFKNDNNNFKE